MNTRASDRVDDLQERRVGDGGTLGNVGRGTGTVGRQVQGVAVDDRVLSDLVGGQGRHKVEHAVLDERVFLVSRRPLELTVAVAVESNLSGPRVGVEAVTKVIGQDFTELANVGNGPVAVVANYAELARSKRNILAGTHCSQPNQIQPECTQ